MLLKIEIIGGRERKVNPRLREDRKVETLQMFQYNIGSIVTSRNTVVILTLDQLIYNLRKQ